MQYGRVRHFSKPGNSSSKMSITNLESLTSHGNLAGRKAILQIIESGLQVTDPYANVKKLVRIDGNRLIVGHRDFEPAGDPASGDEVYELSDLDHIYVIGAGKGIQRAALALEDVLGARNAGVPVALIHRGTRSLFPSFPPDLPAEAAGTPVVSDLTELRTLLQ